jgi:asparagine synthase (glutamine-hydrolysing)
VHLGIPHGAGCVERQRLDLERFSVPVLVHYEDRMSMAWSREIRVPFLDYRLVEYLAPLGVEFKLHKGWTKYIFRKAMEPLLPESITWRKDKQGFVNPQSEWLKKQLRPKVLELFTHESLISTMGFVDVNNLRKKYENYCEQPTGSGSISFKDIFNPLALELWLRRFREFIE